MMSVSSCLLALLATGQGYGPTDPQRLEPGSRQERELVPPDARHAWALELDAQTSVRLTVRPSAMDVVVAVAGPRGEPVAEFDDGWTGGEEQVDWVAETAGSYHLEVRSRWPSVAGRYEIEVGDPRPATAPDRDRAAAARALWEGRRLLEEQKAERTAEAQAAFERALRLGRSAAHVRGEALALSGLGQAAAARSDYPQALERYESALSLWQRLEDGPQQAAALIRMGGVLMKTSRFDEALECGEQAAALSRAGADREGEGRALVEIAAARQFLGQPALAIQANQEALSLLRELGDRRAEAEALSTLANVYYNDFEIDRATDLLRRVLPLTRELGDRYLEALNLNNLGMIYVGVGDGRRGRPYLEQALTLCRELGERAGESIVLSNLANAHRLNGDDELVLETLEQAAALKKALGDRRGQAMNLNTLGHTHAKRGDQAQARRLFEEALAIPEASPDARMAALVNLSSLLVDAGELDRAEERAFELLRVVGGPSLSAARAFHQMARVEQRRGDLGEADALSELALQLFEAGGDRLREAERRASYIASSRDIYDARVDVLMRRQAAESNDGFAVLAFQTAEGSRARGLLDLLAESRADVRQGVDPALLSRESTLRDRLSAASNRRGRAATDSQSLEEEMEALATELERVRYEIRQRSPRYWAMTRPEPVGVDAVRALLDDDTQLLEFALGKEASYAWLVGARSLASAILPAREVIEAAARRALAEMQAPGGKGEAAAELSRLVLGPLAPELTGRRVVIVADGVLQYVPFAALPDPRSGDPLIVRHEVSSLPSASSLALLRQDRPARASAAGTVAVLADPVFDLSDERLAGAASGGVAMASHSLTRAVEEAGFAGPIPRLPFTRREAQAILAAVPAESSLSALDFDASRATLTDPRLARYRIVHFATHGFLNASRPELSGIVLSLYDRDGKPQPGFLTVADTFNLNLAADLVVLSGCQTALGREVNGEGIVGLTRGFMYAGASRVLASLWRVDDAATAALMTRFYSALLGEEALSPVAALRVAQLDLRKQPRFRHPFFWAAFQLQGDWK